MSKPNGLTDFQQKVQRFLKEGKSVLLVAPTGLGKTLAVTADVQESFTKTIYAVPLRALGVGIRDAISELRRDGKAIEPKIHHGDTQESVLFGEEVVVTTYDQVVCGTPGLPLSLPLKAGHAVAGALLMARLILDEVHLAWGISREALSIMLGIINFRSKLGLQTVVQTATLPDKVAALVAKEMNLELVIVGGPDCKNDEGLALREKNRRVTISALSLSPKGKGEGRRLDHGPLDERLADASGKRIYFANTVGRLQETYDRLVGRGIAPETITVLHNRMPRSWREQAEKDAIERFGKRNRDGNWLLLTNQVAEAGLDISAPLVISDPAPVDTLVQRAGRCARWFREKETSGELLIITAPKTFLDDHKTGLALPYDTRIVNEALTLPKGRLDWKAEREWINYAWGGDPEKAIEVVKRALDETVFALNLFDRAAQEHRPGEIASAFRNILSVEIAVENANASRELQELLDGRLYPETSSVSLRRAWRLVHNPKSKARAIRYEEGSLSVVKADYVRPGDVLVVSSDVAVLHRHKGLCFVGESEPQDGELVLKQSDWKRNEVTDKSLSREGGRRQTLLEHTREVIQKTIERLTATGCYHEALINLARSLEPSKDPNLIAKAVIQVTAVAAGLHDLGKADVRWQAKAREIDPQANVELIGRTPNTASRIGLPHTPPGYAATVRACEILLGGLGSAEHLVRSIALASARHHSSLLNPATVDYRFVPHDDAIAFVRWVLSEVDAPEAIKAKAKEIVDAACERPPNDKVPLALPNDDLFPFYALVGRAILMSDRESAAGKALEQWRTGSAVS